MAAAWDGVGRPNRVRSTLAVDTPTALIVILSSRADARYAPTVRVRPSSPSWDVVVEDRRLRDASAAVGSAFLAVYRRAERA